MKQYDKITASDTNINDAIDKILGIFNHRRRNNNTTAFEDFQVLFVKDDLIYALMIVSYDDYQTDTSKAPTARPRWIGALVESPTEETRPFIGSHQDAGYHRIEDLEKDISDL